MAKCKFGSGHQDMETCPMIYIHWPGYYPTDESYLEALQTLCPNWSPGVRILPNGGLVIVYDPDMMVGVEVEDDSQSPY